MTGVHVPDDVTPKLFKRSAGICERCKQRPVSEICSYGSLREFATVEDVVHVCDICHGAVHIDVNRAIRQNLKRTNGERWAHAARYAEYQDIKGDNQRE